MWIFTKNAYWNLHGAQKASITTDVLTLTYDDGKTLSLRYADDPDTFQKAVDCIQGNDQQGEAAYS